MYGLLLRVSPCFGRIFVCNVFRRFVLSRTLAQDDMRVSYWGGGCRTKAIYNTGTRSKTPFSSYNLQRASTTSNAGTLRVTSRGVPPRTVHRLAVADKNSTFSLIICSYSCFTWPFTAGPCIVTEYGSSAAPFVDAIFIVWRRHAMTGAFCPWLFSTAKQAPHRPSFATLVDGERIDEKQYCGCTHTQTYPDPRDNHYDRSHEVFPPFNGDDRPP